MGNITVCVRNTTNSDNVSHVCVCKMPIRRINNVKEFVTKDKPFCVLLKCRYSYLIYFIVNPLMRKFAKCTVKVQLSIDFINSIFFTFAPKIVEIKRYRTLNCAKLKSNMQKVCLKPPTLILGRAKKPEFLLCSRI